MPVTSERVWLDTLHSAPPWKPNDGRTIVVAPHPDDEVLGAGGLIADRRRRHVPVTVVAVTDGEAAYAGVEGLGSLRRNEQSKALARVLGVAESDIIRARSAG